MDKVRLEREGNIGLITIDSLKKVIPNIIMRNFIQADEAYCIGLIDEVLQSNVLEEGLNLEAERFGQICETEDKIKMLMYLLKKENRIFSENRRI